MCGAQYGGYQRWTGLGTSKLQQCSSARQHRCHHRISAARNCLSVVPAAVILLGCIGRVQGFAETHEVSAVAGLDAWLPCNVTSSNSGDDEERPVALILWYKDNSSTPVYTVDARSGSLLQGARHFPGEDEVAARLSFDAGQQPAVLRVSRVEAEDAGVYRCRVDYRQARTENTWSTLRVIVPPQELIVLDEYGQKQVDVLGPYNEGATVLLVCEVEGGDPAPDVLWFKDDDLLDSSFTVLRAQGVVRNELQLGPLRRPDLLSGLLCSASNSNLSEPLTGRLTLDLNLKPTDVKVFLPSASTNGAALVAGEVAEARCVARGARPLAQVAWFKGGQRLQHERMVSREAGSTLSTASFVVRAQDHGAQLTCRADNPSLPGSEISDSVLLNVQYPPQLSLTASERRPHEGDNVTLRCDSNANPDVSAIWWRRDGQLLDWRKDTLSLERVTRAQAGLYECLASNSLGEGFSNQIRLSVLYAPECVTDAGPVDEYAASPELRVACEVRANPSDELHFEWMANTTRRVGRINSLSVNGTRALARAVAGRELEYGRLLCWASNSIGKQRDPCVFHIVPPAPPGSPHNCTVTRQDGDNVAVTCTASSTGGLPVTYFAELLAFRGASATVPPIPVHNTSDDRRPHFGFTGLPREGVLLVRVYAANSQGRSGVTELRFSAGGFRLQHEPKPSGTIDSTTARLPGHILGFLITAVILLTCTVACLTTVRHRKHTGKRKEQAESVELEKCPSQKSFSECVSSDVYQSPDLITSKYGMPGHPDIAVTSPVLHSKFACDSMIDANYNPNRAVADSHMTPVQLKLSSFVGCGHSPESRRMGTTAIPVCLSPVEEASEAGSPKCQNHPRAREDAPSFPGTAQAAGTITTIVRTAVN
ncbi:neural cell adhesion molecule 2-like [Haemaphysalis longicornis]